MNNLKKLWAWEKDQFKKPETRSMVGMVGGFLIGVGTDNIGLGIALAVALGVSGYLSCKKMKREMKKKLM